MFAGIGILVSATISFFSMGLFVYWSMRAILFIRGPEEEVNSVLNCDLWWGRKFYLVLRILFTPWWQSLSI
jgi:hypothetical protein